METALPPLPLILASASPRRRELLASRGIPFTIAIEPVEEIHDDSISLDALTEENARRKAMVVSKRFPEALVLGADTLVYIDDIPLGKPQDLNEARTMLKQLSGRRHQVCTGMALVWEGGNQIHLFHEITRVWFKDLTDSIITDYLSKVHVLDKAGGYAIQECGETLVARIEGCLSNVIGLPTTRLIEELSQLTKIQTRSS